MDEKKIVSKLSTIGILGNVLLAAFKLVSGILGNSGAMISDAVHSLSDVFTTLIAYIGVLMSKRPEDKEHPYGHERLECVASLILGIILAVTGPVVEAMLSSCPVVTSNVSSLPEAAGPDSLLVDPSDIQDIADKIKLLLTDDALRQSVIDKGYRYAMDNFSPKVLADRLMEVYNKLV